MPDRPPEPPEPGDREPEAPSGQEPPEPRDRESAYELLLRGQALMRARHNAQAAVVLERAARIEPNKGSILEALARAYYDSRQHDMAARTFEALLEVDPSNHYGHLGLGLSLERLGRLLEARKHLRLAVAMNPTSETYRKALARVEARAG